MRCKNCGYINAENVFRCAKCNAPLEGSMIEPVRPKPNPPVMPETPDIRSTVKEGNSPQQGSGCPKCGYPAGGGMSTCPQCGSPLTPQRDIRSTVNNLNFPQQDSAFFTLRPISWHGEPTLATLPTFSGSPMPLNRANTDPNNQTITSKTQAILTHEDDGWYIEDKSEQHTTFLRVARKTKLSDGDVIILGNRQFEFKSGDGQ